MSKRRSVAMRFLGVESSMTEEAEARGHLAPADPYATSRAGLFVFIAVVVVLLAASGPGDRSWPLRALGAESGPWPSLYWWGFSAALLLAIALLVLVAARGLPRRGPLLAFVAVAIWTAAQATGCAIRGAGGDEWILATVAVLTIVYSVWLLARLRADDLLSKGGVVLAAIFALAITAALQWIGRWAA
jgi:hypothetical protein